jgi:hypothetical protein
MVERKPTSVIEIFVARWIRLCLFTGPISMMRAMTLDEWITAM